MMPQRAPSLRGQLIRWLVWPLIVLLALSSLITYRLALHLGTAPFDRNLRDIALILHDRLHATAHGIRLELTANAQDILLQDPNDRLYFAILDEQGQLIAGHKGLNLPPILREDAGMVFYDSQHQGHKVRMLAERIHFEGQPITLLVAETTEERDAFIVESLLTLMLPLLSLLLLALFWLMFGLKRALRPLDTLRTQITQRSEHDLTPLSETGMPQEIQPVLHAMNALLARLQRAGETQRQFIADAAHQLRTPLASLRAFAELAERERENPHALHHDLQRLCNAAERASHLVAQLLTLARNEEPLSTQHVEQVALHELIRQHAPDWLHRADQKQQIIDFDIQPATIHGEAFSLGEMLDNLVDNALRYTPTHGTIRIMLHNLPDQIMLCVDDSGPGIPVEARTQVFQRFVRLNNDIEGCGLGLAIVQSIADRHHALLTLDGSPLGGARFCLRFGQN